MNGIINVYKEAGFTSHDVVAKLRGILKQRKIGHTGTLDPEAVGVLPVCLGSATKLCDMLTDQTKEYEAVLLLGIETDTQDMTGQIQAEKECNVSAEEAEAVIRSFIGAYEQIPPMYSARKVNGKKLYELAREGKSIERKARSVMIEQITIEQIQLPRIRMRVTCSKGTYIRTLCHDIGQKLGTGGVMESLVRTRVGSFLLEDAKKLKELEQESRDGSVLKSVLAVDQMFLDKRVLTVQPLFCKLVENGNCITASQLTEKVTLFAEEQVRIYDKFGRFYGIYGYEQKADRLKPVKMFLEQG